MIGKVDIDRFESVIDVHKRHFAYSMEARKELGLTDDHPMPKKLWEKWLDESYELSAD